MAALVLVSCATERWEPRAKREREAEASASMPPGSVLRVDMKNGPITVQGADIDECRLAAKIQVRATSKEKAKEVADAIQVRLERSTEGLAVVTDAPSLSGIGDYSIALTLTVPRRSVPRLMTGAGDVRLKDIEGAVDAGTSQGDVRIDNVKGDIRAKSFSGEVRCTQIEAATVELYTRGGNMWLDQAKTTSCKAETSDGSVYLADLKTDSLDVQTTDGGIRCQNVAANKLNCTSSNGSVFITWPADGPRSPDVTVNLISGNITFAGITQMSTALDAFTSSGSISAEIPGEKTRPDKLLRTTIGAGGGRLVLTTHEGSITIR